MTLLLADTPWPWNWEAIAEIREEAGKLCDHDWQLVTVRKPGWCHDEVVSWCPKCLAPQCGDLLDGAARCVERRHHKSPHRYGDGTFEPVGGGEVWR